MKTSELNIRPFKPSKLDEGKEGREPFATLTFGNVTLELDYTIIRDLKMDNKSDLAYGAVSAFGKGMEEIFNEMNLDLYRDMPANHRDNKNSRYVQDRFRNPYHPDALPKNGNIVLGAMKDLDTPTTTKHRLSQKTKDFYAKV